MNTRFSSLSSLSWLLKGAGILAILAALLFFLYATFGSGGQEKARFFNGAAFFISGLLILVASEIIGVLFAIEENTRTSSPGGAPAPPAEDAGSAPVRNPEPSIAFDPSARR